MGHFFPQASHFSWVIGNYEKPNPTKPSANTLLLRPNAIYFFEMSVLFETGELNAYVYDGGGLYRRKYVRTEGKGRTTTITLADGKLLPCIATRG